MDNMLSMLESIKLFFSVKNIIVVLAVDMEKIKSAWGARYEKDPWEGSGYVDKLFQMKLPIPNKSRLQMKGYIESLATSYKSRAKDLADLLPSNPRKVKLALNFIHSTGLDMGNVDQGSERFRKIYAAIAWFSARDANGKLEVLVRRSPRDFVSLAWLCSSYQGHLAFKKYVETIPRKTGSGSPSFMGEDNTLVVTAEFVTEPLLEMVSMCSADPELFRILQQYGLRIRNDIDTSVHQYISVDDRGGFEDAWRLFYSVVQYT